MDKKKLKQLLYAIKDKKFFRTNLLDIDYSPYQLIKEISFLLDHGLIAHWSIGYYQRLFDGDDVDFVYRNLCKENGL